MDGVKAWGFAEPGSLPLTEQAALHQMKQLVKQHPVRFSNIQYMRYHETGWTRQLVPFKWAILRLLSGPDFVRTLEKRPMTQTRQVPKDTCLVRCRVGLRPVYIGMVPRLEDSEAVSQLARVCLLGDVFYMYQDPCQELGGERDTPFSPLFGAINTSPLEGPGTCYDKNMAVLQCDSTSPPQPTFSGGSWSLTGDGAGYQPSPLNMFHEPQFGGSHGGRARSLAKVDSIMAFP